MGYGKYGWRKYAAAGAGYLATRAYNEADTWVRNATGRLVRNAPSAIYNAGANTLNNQWNRPSYRNYVQSKKTHNSSHNRPGLKISSENNNQMYKLAGRVPKGRYVSKKTNRLDLKPNIIKSMIQRTITSPLNMPGSTVETNCVYLNVASHIPNVVASDIVSSIIRQLFWSLGYSIGDFANTLQNYPVGYSFEFFYTYRNSSGQQVPVTLGNISLSSTPQNMSSTLESSFRTRLDFELLLTVGLNVLNSALYQMDKSIIYCDKAYAHVDFFSQVRIQNFSGTVTDETSRDSVPLVAKVYEGYGMGPVLAGQNTQGTGYQASFVPSVDGNLKFVNAYTTNYLQQAPPAKTFTNCNREANFKLENGDIKTRALKYRKKLPLSQLLKYLDTEMAGTTTNEVNEFGHYVCFAFEKAIGNSEAITIKVESDSYNHVYITGGRRPAIVLPTVTIV